MIYCSNRKRNNCLLMANTLIYTNLHTNRCCNMLNTIIFFIIHQIQATHMCTFSVVNLHKRKRQTYSTIASCKVTKEWRGFVCFVDICRRLGGCSENKGGVERGWLKGGLARRKSVSDAYMLQTVIAGRSRVGCWVHFWGGLLLVSLQNNMWGIFEIGLW